MEVLFGEGALFSKQDNNRTDCRNPLTLEQPQADRIFYYLVQLQEVWVQGVGQGGG